MKLLYVLLPSLISSTFVLCANAEIVFSGPEEILIRPIDYRITSPSSVPDPAALRLDLTGDGVADFSFFTTAVGPSLTLFGARGANGSFYGIGSSSSVLEGLAAGVSVGSGSQWTSGVTGGIPLAAPGQDWWDDHWFGYVGGSIGKPFFLATKLKTSGTYHFGWIELSFVPDGPANDLLIRDWAYESEPLVPILTGAVGPTTSAVPEPGTYGFLAALSLGVLALLRKRGA